MSLYNVSRDPAEAQDLADTEPGALGELSERLLAYAREAAKVP